MVTTERAMVSGLAECGSPKVVSPMINSVIVDICEIRRYFIRGLARIFIAGWAGSAMSSVSQIYTCYRLVFSNVSILFYYASCFRVWGKIKHK